MTDDVTSAFVAAVPMPMMLINAQRQVAAINPQLTAILGPDLIGRHFITALRQPILLEAIEASLRHRKPGSGRYLGREGQRDTTYLVHIAPVGDLLALTFEDRTASEDISQLRRDFVANVSHELRTPLTALNGFIETLRGPARDDPAARDRFLTIMERETSRMTRLVGDLLSLSRVEENERLRPSDPVALSDLIKQTLAELAPVVQRAGTKITLSDKSDGAEIPGDPNQLRQVVGNLIENAIKYGAEGGAVQIDLSEVEYVPFLRSAGLILRVTNDGDGIAPHHIPRLTERFYRVDAHRSREVGGTGLGLAIVKHIVNRHRGRLKIDSDLGAPTVVTIMLPAQLPHETEAPV